MITDIGYRSHYFKIIVLDDLRNVIDKLIWRDMSFELRTKYDWYFKYRAALMQVKYPKLQVQVFWGNEPSTGETLERLKNNKIRAKKAKITEYQNKIDRARKDWKDLFPIEDSPEFQRYLRKLDSLQCDLRTIQQQTQTV